MTLIYDSDFQIENEVSEQWFEGANVPAWGSFGGGSALCDLRSEYLTNEGAAGSQPEKELSWLKANGATSNARMDAWKQFLEMQGFIYTTYTDSRKNWLVSQGFSGSVQDMLNQFWAVTPGLLETTQLEVDTEMGNFN